MRFLCRVFGHRRWYYDEPETGDFVFGCVRCMNPVEVKDRLIKESVPGRPDLVLVNMGFFDRMRARMEML